jgi:addiction module RelE/StbE family toxin
MKYQIKLTEPVKQDFKSASGYIALELQNKAAAINLLQEVRASIHSLAETPFRHALVADEVLAAQGFRCFVVHHYLLFYIVREKTETVIIERFLYGRRDWMNILKGEI